ncbi:hypothetical protein AAC978_05055 [Desulfitobacterium sp. THU1]|uniref:hypothetical protein n=1 Tax=Desulfitobacterium sp. THU1 TaxID=3138072 RepID=UPI00311F880B
MRTKRASKTLALFLAVCMAMTMLPTAVFAEADGDITTFIELQNALSSTTPNPNITLGNDISLGGGITLGANHTLNTNGKILSTDNQCMITKDYTLTINGGGRVNIPNGADHPGIKSTPSSSEEPFYGTLNLENVTINLTNGKDGRGLEGISINVGTDATINLNSNKNEHIILNDNNTLTINSGGTVNLTNFRESGILNDGTVHMNGGTLNLGATSGGHSSLRCDSDSLLKYTSGTLTADAGGTIGLELGARVEGLGGRLKDRNTDFTAAGEVTVGGPDAVASANGLTKGIYIYNSTSNKFEKSAIEITTEPQNVTVTQGAITGSLTVAATTTNGNPISYQWYNGDTFIPIDGEPGSSFSIPTDLEAGTYHYYCVLNAEGCMNVSTDPATVTVNPPGGTPTYTATLNIQLDGAPSGLFVGDFTLKLAGNESTIAAMTGMGATRTASVQSGTWKVYFDDADTGVTISVSSAPASATLDWISVNSGIIPKGTATGGKINVNGYDYSQLAFLKGDTLTFTASGAGAASYTYAWSGTHNGSAISGTGNTYTIDSVQGKVEIACTITGSTTTNTYLNVLDTPVTDANKDSITGQGISGGVSYDPATKILTLNNAVITPSSFVIEAIYAEDDLTVKLVGQNQIGTAPNNPANSAEYSLQMGIASSKSLSLTGEGSLTIYDSITGIFGVENLTIDIGGILIVAEYGNEGLACCLKTNGVLTIEKGNLNLTSYNSKGLQGGSIVINGGVITAQTQAHPVTSLSVRSLPSAVPMRTGYTPGRTHPRLWKYQALSRQPSPPANMCGYSRRVRKFIRFPLIQTAAMLSTPVP